VNIIRQKCERFMSYGMGIHEEAADLFEGQSNQSKSDFVA